MDRRTLAGSLFEEPPGVQPISPHSWLNDPRHREFAAAYEFARTRFNALAAKTFAGLTAEQVYLVWKSVQTAFAGIERQSVIERFPR